MAHFAKIDDDNLVVRVTKLDNNVLLDEGDTEVESKGAAFLERVLKGGRWIQTSYNTRGGVHRGGGTPLRKNYAGRGYTYDESRDAFIPPKPFSSWTLDEDTCRWNPPVPYPEVEVVEGEMPPMYGWNEDEQKWDEMEMP